MALRRRPTLLLLVELLLITLTPPSESGNIIQAFTRKSVPLIGAAGAGDLATLKTLLEPPDGTEKADTEERNQYGDTAIHVAAIGGDLEVLAYLLGQGANPNTVRRPPEH